MRRDGFTMVELIFVIIIIGILSVAAIPKFGDIKDRAKINSEYSALSGLESAITAKMEFAMEDQNNIAIDWHNTPYVSSTATEYGTANTNKKVLSAVAKKSDSLRLVKFVNLDSNGDIETDTDIYYDVLFIEGAASNHTTGVVKETDVAGRPDKNDVWVFNASPIDIIVESGATPDKITVASGEIKLVDISGTTAVTYVNDGADADGEIGVTKSDGTDLTITSI